MPPELPKKRLSLKELFLPIVIIVAGCIIAFSLYAVRIRNSVEHGSGQPEAVLPVTPADHIIGNPSAPIVLVEYSDIDSAYGKKLQLTMEQLMTDYATGDKVAWVYRHFPVTTIHPSSSMHALAAECAASVSNPQMFFRFIDALNAAAPGATVFNPQNYGTIVSQLGLPKDKFDACVSSRTFENKVHTDYSNALAAGATASPYIILIVQGQKPRAIEGAPPYKTLKQIIDSEIAKLAQ